MPRGVLTSRSTQTLRQRLLEERPPRLIQTPSSASHFHQANVYVTLLVLGLKGRCVVGRGNEPLRPATIDGLNWWAPLLDAGKTDAAQGYTAAPSLGTEESAFEVFASMTAAMAYDLAPLLAEEAETEGARLVTTGLIDPGVCLWGRRRCRYLRRDFDRPVVPDEAPLSLQLRRRLQKVRRPKILVGGLSNRVEAFLDWDGRYCGAVSTYTIVHCRDDRAALERLCDFLNGPAATERLHREMGAHAMGGGRITLTKDFVRRLFSSHNSSGIL
jgi:hypothetical protein